MRRWDIPEGLRILPDGAWTVGELHVVHPPSLRYLKAHLVFEDGGPFIVDGPQRMPVTVDGPPFEAVRLVVDEATQKAWVVLDDGSREAVEDGSLGMNAETGRFEAAARGGRSRALLSRGAHQALLERLEEEGGRFFLRAGRRRIAVRT
ncbi:MAG TPA: hypothetical protein VGQ78_04175 [Vicinamibacteria bacterium]|jgi:hypothetical protein|nr:hypothetical protein [Vicinamibacteria bacterium]